MRFVFVKATESTTYVNPYFASDRSAAISSGMGVGAYHFANPAVDPIAQAQYFLSATGSNSGWGILPPVLDLEQTGGLSPAAVTSWALTWLQYVQNATGRVPIFYSYPYFISNSMTANPLLASYPLWLASYTSITPAAPAPWNAWLFWQYTSQGSIPGISGNVDRNKYNGNQQSLNSLAGMSSEVGSGDMYVTIANATGSGRVEVHTLSRGSGYAVFNSHIATALAAVPDPDNWRFFYVPFSGAGSHDLMAVHTANTGSGRVEVHVMSQASGYQSWIAHLATPLGVVPPGQAQFQIGSVDFDRAPDLFFIPTQATGSGAVEVHVLSAASQYQGFLIHAATSLGAVPSDQFTFLAGGANGPGDLSFVIRYGTGSGSSELHTLTRGSGYKGYSAHVALPLGSTQSPLTEYTLADYSRDGIPDLVLATHANTGSGWGELHILGGSIGYRDWIAHIATGWGGSTSNAVFAGLLT